MVALLRSISPDMPRICVWLVFTAAACADRDQHMCVCAHEVPACAIQSCETDCWAAACLPMALQLQQQQQMHIGTMTVYMSASV